MKNYSEVTIIGAGLAGTTLALQLINENENLSITLIEKRNGKAPISAHKVGESTVELGTFYLREVLGLKDYLIKNHLPKKGLRYFLSPKHKNAIEKRLEIGPKIKLPAPSHQLDRGILENDLIDLVISKGVLYIDNAKVKDVEINRRGNHTLTYKKDKENITIETKWIVDTSGRGFFLKKKLELKKELNHKINSAWFRLKGIVDVNEWSNNKEWNTLLEPETRKLGTCHLMDTGYWVWIIPLVNGNTSMGIVADPRYHKLEDYNSYEKAMNWFSTNEPQAYEKLKAYDYEVMDFKALKHFAYDTKKYYSNQRWATTGEAGSFLDPFYSPGTDLIAINNTFISDLILKDFVNEDILMPTMLYDIVYNELVKNWAPIYIDKYSLFGNTQIMVVKIFWDWAVYWTFPSLIFINKGYTNIQTLKYLFTQKNSPFPKVASIGLNMQNFFLDWNKFKTNEKEGYIDYIEMDCVHKMQTDITKQLNQEELKVLIAENLSLLEELATEIFSKATKDIFHFDIENINPYTFKLKENKEAMIQYSNETKGTKVSPEIKKDLTVIW
tara:strand:+ start:5366 stop:7030 length:1665 start_codon:yes stop_codon:yes gene_type:complete